MGHPDGAHTHGSGGSGLGMAVLVVVGAALVVKLAGPVLAAVAELVRVILIVAGVILGIGIAGLVGLLAFRVRRRLRGAARVEPPNPGAVSPLHGVARAARPLPQPRPAIEHPTEVHLHLHRITHADIAAILAQENLPQDRNEPAGPDRHERR
jgi:hypothetical protein